MFLIIKAIIRNYF